MTENKFKPDEYFDIHGKETNDIDLARSKVEFRPNDFRFFVKVTYRPLFGFSKPAYRWKFHHSSPSFGSWMWPAGMPLRFDGVDQVQRCVDHAISIGSDWRPGVDS